MVYKGTTTVGMVCSEGVVLATDTRVTSGTYIAHKKGKKLHRIDDHLAMTIAGVVADAQNVIETIRYHANIYRIEKHEPMPVSSAARLASNLFFTYRLYPLIAEVLVGGYDSKGPNLYIIDFFGSLVSEDFASTGSGSPIAYGILESEYKKGMELDDGVKLAVKAITSAMRRDTATGDSFDVAVITSQGFRELSQEEKERLLASIWVRT
jgi:proteasome beta subunit